MTQPIQPERPTRCAGCAVEFVAGPHPHRVGKRLVVCSEACQSVVAVTEVERLEGWLSLIAAKSRGTAGDYAGVALYSNQVAWRKGVL